MVSTKHRRDSPPHPPTLQKKRTITVNPIQTRGGGSHLRLFTTQFEHISTYLSPRISDLPPAMLQHDHNIFDHKLQNQCFIVVYFLCLFTYNCLHVLWCNKQNSFTLFGESVSPGQDLGLQDSYATLMNVMISMDNLRI